MLKSDVSIAKNYLNSEELQSLGCIVSAYLDLVEDMASRNIPMYRAKNHFVEVNKMVRMSSGKKMIKKIELSKKN